MAYDPVLGSALIGHGVELIDPFSADGLRAPVTEGSVWLVGACGGAGVTTLVELINEHVGAPVAAEGIDPQRFAGLIAPANPALYGGVPFGAPVWVVTRLDDHGLTAAAGLASRHSNAHIPWDIVGLIGVHPPVPASKEVINRAKAIKPIFAQTLMVPWETGVNDPTQMLSRRFRDSVDAVIASGAAAAAPGPAEAAVVEGKVLKKQQTGWGKK